MEEFEINKMRVQKRTLTTDANEIQTTVREYFENIQ